VIEMMAKKGKMEISSIQVSKELREKLATLGSKGQSYEDIIWNIMKKARVA
jgi:hypothetical protein